jgi:hypothetical protein
MVLAVLHEIVPTVAKQIRDISLGWVNWERKVMQQMLIQICDVERIDALELQGKEPSTQISDQGEGHDPAQYELALVTVTIAAAAIAALSAWLLKNRKSHLIESELVLIGADGSRIKHKLRYRLNESIATRESEAALTTYLQTLIDNAGQQG